MYPTFPLFDASAAATPARYALSLVEKTREATFSKSMLESLIMAKEIFGYSVATFFRASAYL
ncbi:unannotated protein [freshwater metagenome]|uniref:Unannotated protein n=1 Tax=freshwater metagenome TaxID=449393 RepID=A0A6J6LAL4_9ZZZZ